MQRNFSNLVLICDRSYVAGGASKMAVETALSMRDKNIDVTFFCAIGPADKRLIDSGVRVVCLQQGDLLEARNLLRGALQGLWNWLAYYTLDELLSNYRSDDTVIHIHSWTHALSPSIFAVLAKYNFKTVITAHEYFLICPNGGLYNYKKKTICDITPSSVKCMCCSCDKKNYVYKMFRNVRACIQNRLLQTVAPSVIYVSKSSKAHIDSQLKWGSNRYICSNYVEASRVVLQEPIKEDARTRYLFVGRISPEKGCDMFCQALTELRLEGEVIGDGPQRRELEEKYPSIHFTGALGHSDVLKHMVDAKALIMSSVCYETFGLVAYEGFITSCLPCITSDSSDLAEIVNARKIGIVYRAGDLAALKEAIRKFEIDGVQAKARHNIHSTDFSCFSKDAYQKRMVRIYRSIIDGCDAEYE